MDGYIVPRYWPFRATQSACLWLDGFDYDGGSVEECFNVEGIVVAGTDDRVRSHSFSVLEQFIECGTTRSPFVAGYLRLFRRQSFLSSDIQRILDMIPPIGGAEHPSRGWPAFLAVSCPSVSLPFSQYARRSSAVELSPLSTCRHDRSGPGSGSFPCP